MIEILHRYTKAVLYHSETATTILEALGDANLRDANLRGANLGGADRDPESIKYVSPPGLIASRPGQEPDVERGLC